MTVREITTHLVEGERNPITLKTLDQPGPGGAYHWYQLTGFDYSKNASHCPNPYPVAYEKDWTTGLSVYFQNGVVSDEGPNGVTIESLLAICADRLECFQAGPYSSEQNQVALAAIHVAINALQVRTRSRLAAGTKHTMEK